jgi:hypothetical protein
MDLPMSLWISWTLPFIFPFTASREVRSAVLRGSIEYSAVTQPFPLPRKNGGTSSETEAVQRTFVFPIETRTEPSA